jgi:hypothetical protein
MQVPPFTQGYEPHSFWLNSQWLPAQPFVQVHLYCTTHAAALHAPSAQVAPFMHGVDEHSLMAEQALPPLDVS